MAAKKQILPRIFVIGSINIDHIYEVPRLPVEGECIVATSYRREIGGKGLNQAYAIFSVAHLLYDSLYRSSLVWSARGKVLRSNRARR